ncbi:MAG: ABC transporter ATP-binding protein/permease [Ruaniaceae bacterium]|nr:ABC transporter ATP-binding protein/permease [Ruaniaceae bacterium]
MQLPVADGRTVWRYSRRLLADYRGGLIAVVAIQAGAAIAALAVPWLLGGLIDDVRAGTTAEHVNQVGLLLLLSVVVQTAFSAVGQRQAMVLGEKIFARLREEFVSIVTHLPLSTVERAGTGDLLGRTTNDVDRVQWVVRFGVPRLLVTSVTILLTLGAAFAVSPATSLGLIVGVPILVLFGRWYLKRATPAYLANSQAYAVLNGAVSETVEQATAVDTLAIGPRRRSAMRDAMAEVWKWERHTLFLRAVLFIGMVIGYAVPTAIIVLWGAWLVSSGAATVGAVTTVALYSIQWRGAIGELMFWIDETQVATASLARILGVNMVEPDRYPSGKTPTDSHIESRGVRYAYREGHDVLHGIDLDLRPGERLAIVGPSGAGKSTFGRMLAGIHPPGGGTVTAGGVPLVDLTEEELRRQVILVTQEHHVFLGTLADNLRLARPGASEGEMRRALRVVGATWANQLERGLETEVGSGAYTLTPAQAQQLALARIVLLDPHTLVLDEATSLLDPRAARSLEGSLAQVLKDRTVVAIAHRLHTAHDADRVAVIEDGLISELGPHDELVAVGGQYAALWESWRQE